MTMDFQGKKALITGASGSIGSATAKLLHSLGAHVIISGTNQSKLSALGDELKENYTIATCDLHDLDACNEMVANEKELDILICNAGITKDTLALRMNDEMFDEVIKVNLSASFTMNRAAIKNMLRKKYGRIINISSVVGVSGNPGQANYCASKAGLIGMSKSLALEVASKNITINCVAPGFIISNMTDKLNEKQVEHVMNNIPAKSLGQPEDIAHGIAYLASDEARYVTGQTLHINGGMLMV